MKENGCAAWAPSPSLIQRDCVGSGLRTVSLCMCMYSVLRIPHPTASPLSTQPRNPHLSTYLLLDCLFEPLIELMHAPSFMADTRVFWAQVNVTGSFAVDGVETPLLVWLHQLLGINEAVRIGWAPYANLLDILPQLLRGSSLGGAELVVVRPDSTMMSLPLISCLL